MKDKNPAPLLTFLSALLFLTASGQAQTNKADSFSPNPLAGTWRLIEFYNIDTLTGKQIYLYGQHPKAYFTYTKSGIVYINISTGNPIRISEDSAKKISVNYFDINEYNALGYFGTYTIDWEKSIVTHHVKGGSLPWYIDTDQPRLFTLKGDTLIIDNNKIWKRVLVRAD